MKREQQMQDMMTAAFWRDIEEGNQPDSADAIEIAKTYERAYQQGWKDADSYPNWIPVDERKPEVEDLYIVSNGKATSVAYWVDDDWDSFGDVITHWMPLPIPPQGKGE